MVDEARPPRIAKYTVTAKSEFAVSPSEAGSSWSSSRGTTSTVEVAAVANSADEARPLGSAKDRAMTAASAVDPAGAKSVDVGQTSRQKSIDAEQLIQRLEEQLLKMGRLEKLWEKFERLEQAVKERSPSYQFCQQACGRIS